MKFLSMFVNLFEMILWMVLTILVTKYLGGKTFIKEKPLICTCDFKILTKNLHAKCKFAKFNASALILLLKIMIKKINLLVNFGCLRYTFVVYKIIANWIQNWQYMCNLKIKIYKRLTKWQNANVYLEGIMTKEWILVWSIWWWIIWMVYITL